MLAANCLVLSSTPLKLAVFHNVIIIMFYFFRDLRAQLELAVVEVLQLISEPEVLPDSDYMSDSEGAASVQCNGKLASAVRKHLAMGIQNLMQHGLMPVKKRVFLMNSSLQNCFIFLSLR